MLVGSFIAPVVLAFSLSPTPARVTRPEAVTLTPSGPRVAISALPRASRIVCEVAATPTAEIHADADAVFNVIDVDGDGTVTLTEITDHLEKSGYKPDAVAKIFEKLDTDKSGCISRDELR